MITSMHNFLTLSIEMENGWKIVLIGFLTHTQQSQFRLKMP